MKRILLLAALAAICSHAHAVQLWNLWVADDPHITNTAPAEDPLGLVGANWYRLDFDLYIPDAQPHATWNELFDPLEPDGFNFERFSFRLFETSALGTPLFVFENPYDTPENFVSFETYKGGDFSEVSHEFQWMDFITNTFASGPYAGWFLDVHMSDAIITAQIIHEAGSYDPYVFSGWLNHASPSPIPDSSTTLPLLGLAVGAIAIASRRIRKS